MNPFRVSPEDCLILRAFRDSGSLRAAAATLGCDPAGLQRKVKRISEDYGYLQKVERSWRLTASGRALAAWVEDSIRSQRALLRSTSEIRIASTAWFAEQALIPRIRELERALPPEVKVALAVPGRSFERELLEGTADFVVVCHPPEDPGIAHRRIAAEEWAVFAPRAWRVQVGKEAKLRGLLARPHVRHRQLNPDPVLAAAGVESPENGVLVDNLVGARASIVAGLGWGFVPRILMRAELRRKSVWEIPSGVVMDRTICLWWLRARAESRKLAPKIAAWVANAAGEI